MGRRGGGTAAAANGSMKKKLNMVVNWHRAWFTSVGQLVGCLPFAHSILRWWKRRSLSYRNSIMQNRDGPHNPIRSFLFFIFSCIVTMIKSAIPLLLVPCYHLFFTSDSANFVSSHTNRTMLKFRKKTNKQNKQTHRADCDFGERKATARYFIARRDPDCLNV